MAKSPELPHIFPKEGLMEKRANVLTRITPFVEEKLTLLLDPNKAWQPSLVLPSPESLEFKQIQLEAKMLTPETKVVIVGSLITEDGLPNFTAEISRFGESFGIDEKEDSPWEKWRRGWASEEDRHGRLIEMYVRDSGGFNVTQIERDVHAYIRDGFYPGHGKDSYQALMYTAWQERATQDSHRGLARVAKTAGAEYLYKAAGRMAGDEGRHAQFYIPVVGEIFRLDPEGATHSLSELVARGLIMPGSKMSGFNAFVEASSVSGVYGGIEYTSILQELIQTWGVKSISLSGQADQKRHALIDRADRLTKIAERARPRNNSNSLEALKQRWIT